MAPRELAGERPLLRERGALKEALASREARLLGRGELHSLSTGELVSRRGLSLLQVCALEIAACLSFVLESHIHQGCTSVFGKVK